MLSVLEHMGRKRPLLLVADNLHWWDSDSIAFLGRLRDPRMWDVYPFLEELRVVATRTTEQYQPAAHPAALETLLTPTTTRAFTLERIPREGFERVLVLLDASPEPPADVTDLVHQLTDGHLALAASIAPRLTTADVETLLAAADTEEFLQRLLTERMQTLGPMGRQAVALLQVAAVLGLSFRRREIMCASGSDDAETARVLRYCRDERMLEISDDLAHFVHDVFRRHFSGADGQDKVAIHERLDRCLRELRPAEYDLRCLNALDAEAPRRAAALGVQAAIQAEREGRSWLQLPQPVLVAISHSGYDAVARTFALAIGHLKHYRFDDCLEALDELPHNLGQSLTAEADHLRAMCLMSTRSEHDREEGRRILKRWDEYVHEEPELGMRLLQLRLYGLTHLADKEPGRDLEDRIRSILEERSSIDVAARDAIHTLNRCAGSLHDPDYALRQVRRAVRYFGPESGQTVLRRPVEYYRCLVNFGANLIANARYEEARAVHQDLERLRAEHADGIFPRPDYPRMNALLADYRSGAVSADEAAARQQEIVAALGVDTDPFYPGNALAVYHALADRHDESLAIFDRLEAEIARRRDPEPSMLYLIRANRCAARFVAGTPVREDWARLDETVRSIAYVTRPFLIKRHELLAEVIAGGEHMTARAFDECLVKGRPPEFGPFWANYGRGFRMPEVEFWREN